MNKKHTLTAKVASSILGKSIAGGLSEVILPFFSTGNTTSGVLCPDLSSTVQDKHGLNGESLAQGHENN